MVVEYGTHNELLEMKGYYYELYNTVAEKQKKEKEQNYDNKIKRLNNDEEVDIVVEDDLLIDPKFSSQLKISKSLTKLSIGDNKKSYYGTENILLKHSINDEIYVHKDLERIDSEIAREDIMQPLSNRCNQNKAAVKLDDLIQEDLKEELNQEKKKFAKLRYRLMSMLKDDKYFVIGGAIVASCNGAVWPIYGILLADAIGTLADPDMEQVREGGRNVAIMFFALAIAAAIILWMQK